MKKFIIVLTILFISTMLFFTFFAQSLHKKMIPNVHVTRLTKQSFKYEFDNVDGITKENVVKISLAIPKDLYCQGDFYTITHVMRNGSNRTITVKINIEIGLENDKYYEVANSGYTQNIILITKTNKEFNEGDEVYIIN